MDFYKNLEVFLLDNGCNLSNFSYGGEIDKFISIQSVTDKRGRKSRSFKVIKNNDGSIVVIMNDFKTGEQISTRLDNNINCKPLIKLANQERLDRQKKEQEEALKNIKEYFFSLKLNQNKSNKYLKRKKVRSAKFIRWDRKGNFYIPLINTHRQLQSYQKITPDGRKILAKGGHKKGAFFTIGEVKEANILVFAEGYSTAKTIHEITDYTTVMCVDVGNIYPVIKAFREKYPNKLFIIAADNDIDTERNPAIGYNVGIKKAEACFEVF